MLSSKTTHFILALLLLTGTMAAQEIWSLERCILYARDNNITVKQSEASVRIALLSERQAKASRLPYLNASFNAGEQFGRTIDRTTNTFSTNAIGFNSVGLNAGAQVFSGGQIHHSVKQAGWDLKTAEADAAQTMNNLSLQIAQAYLLILLTEEQLKSAERRVSQSNDQLKVTLKLIDAGNIPMGDKFNLEAQIARDEQSAVTVQNNVELAYLNLKQLLQLEPDYPLKIERPAIPIPTDANPDGLTLSPLYSTASTTQPSIRAAEFRVRSAGEGIALARSAYYPTVSLYAQLSSNFSTQYRNAVSTGFSKSNPTPVVIGVDTVPVSFIQENFAFQKVGYFDQFNQNFGQNIGVSVSIPIYQNGRTRLSVERARLAVLSAEMQQTQIQQQLKNDIQTAIANARAGRKQLDAAQKTFASMQTAFKNTEKRHSLGAVNSLELTTAQTNLNIAENDLIVAKYDYLFKLKILDFYEGKALQLN